MKTFVVLNKDKHCDLIKAETEEEAIRKSDNLSDDADLQYASSVIWGEYEKEITDEMIDEHDCRIAMKHGNECQCGNHR